MHDVEPTSTEVLIFLKFHENPPISSEIMLMPKMLNTKTVLISLLGGNDNKQTQNDFITAAADKNQKG